MKKYFIIAFLLGFFGISFSQISFVVLNPNEQPAGGVDVLYNTKAIGKTDSKGKVIVPKLADGGTILFKFGELTATYVINNGAASGIDQKIKLGAPTQFSEREKDLYFGSMVEPTKDEIFDEVDERAEFPGGATAMTAYIKTYIQYPQTAKENGLEGKCYLRFIIEKDGSINDVRVLRGVPECPACDMEAKLGVKKMPRWKPGKVNGNPVRSIYELQITFDPKKQN